MIKRISFFIFLGILVFKTMHVPTTIDWSIGRLPVLHDGRVKPFDTLARHYLLQIQGRLRVPSNASPTEWLFSMMTRESAFKSDNIILVEHPKLFDAIDNRFHKQKFRVSELFLSQHIERIKPLISSAMLLEKEQRTPIQNSALQVFNRYQAMQNLRTQFFPYNNGSQLGFWNHMLELSQSMDKKDIQSSPKLQPFLEKYNELASLNSSTYFIFGDQWVTIPEAALDQTQTHQILLENYLLLSDAFNQYITNESSPEPHKTQISAYSDGINHLFYQTNKWQSILVNLEFLFNFLNPFSVAMVLYGLIIMMVFLSRFTRFLTANTIIQTTWGLALSFHLFGLIARIIILMRPPVINLYSSAIFVAFISSAIGFFMYKKTRALFYAGYVSTLSALSLIVAYHLSLSGDTMEVMQAVLNSNFWLATHVVTITIGYAIIFMAGFFAISYVLIGTLTTIMTPEFEQRLVRTVHVFLLISLFFNLLGTVLGGIWADQSWGRFWGWDPKENGAILIVIWTAIILHMKWGKLIKVRGLMNLTIGSNMVTMWSWKGTNMLGIGLHSYGFTESTFYWLMMFFASQITIMALGCLPYRYWRSFLK
ncbi:MAG: cytochrome c biogenesis protein CcsA [Candidatus Margulisbacteria bacterium]|nr:cytochrome c biogenesis protein CcsA [Candidatus Margulisiibacteriota bacterium]